MANSKKPSKRPDVGRLLDRLAVREQQFLRSAFLAPALGRGFVRVRIAGAVCKLKTQPADVVGWGVFQPEDFTQARLERHATLVERRRYLDLFPLVRLIAARREHVRWLCSAAGSGNRHVQVAGLVPVELAEGIQQFDALVTRFDGTTFWFDEIDMRRDPAAAAYLRGSFRERLPPDALRRPGLTAAERAAYELNYWMELDPPRVARSGGGASPIRQRGRSSHEETRDPVRQRLRKSLSHGGARLIDYLERSDAYRVTYTVGARRYTSSVTKDDLTVQVAGICLSGADHEFDLSSLVGVLREAEGGDAIVPMGNEDTALDEDDY